VINSSSSIVHLPHTTDDPSRRKPNIAGLKKLKKEQEREKEEFDQIIISFYVISLFIISLYLFSVAHEKLGWSPKWNVK